MTSHLTFLYADRTSGQGENMTISLTDPFMTTSGHDVRNHGNR